MILTIFVSDSDSNQEAFQEENREEDESEEEEVDRHVPQGTIKSYCFTYINFSTYQFCGCGEKDGGPFFSYHRTAQHSLGRTCTLKVFEL